MAKQFMNKRVIKPNMYVPSIRSTKVYRCLVLLCSNLRLEVSGFRDLSQFIDLRYVDFVLFSATHRLVFGDIISCNRVNLLKLMQSKNLVANRKSTYSNYKNTRFE